MIKMLTASTREVDDGELAAREILEQLDLENNAMKHSVGMLVCTLEFMQSGAVAAICKAMPFEVAGCNTTAGGVYGSGEGPMLCLAVLTSDEAEFAVALSESLLKNEQESYDRMFAEANGKLTQEPKLALAFLPILPNLDDRVMCNLLFQAAGGLPVFGTLAFDFMENPRMPLTLCGGVCYADRAAVILISGPVQPRFEMINIPPESIKKQKAIITRAQENMIMEVNGVPAVRFMQSLGIYFTPESGVTALNVNPLMIDCGDGSAPESRPVSSVTTAGYLVCSGLIPQGASLGVSILEAATVEQTCRGLCEALTGMDGARAAFLFSCASRQFLLAWEEMAEIKAAEEILGAGLPYLFAYSGGEVFPVPAGDGGVENRYFNNTLIACVL
jgi:hypothetical protein